MEPTADPLTDDPVWDDPDRCPFCRTALVDGGAGFVDHVADAPPCRERFEAWLAAVRDDIGGDWSG